MAFLDMPKHSADELGRKAHQWYMIGIVTTVLGGVAIIVSQVFEVSPVPALMIFLSGLSSFICAYDYRRSYWRKQTQDVA